MRKEEYSTHTLRRTKASIIYKAMGDVIAGVDLETELPRIACPVLVVAGAEDPNAPPAAGRRIAELIPGASYHEFAGVGRLPPIEAPLFNRFFRVIAKGVASDPRMTPIGPS